MACLVLSLVLGASFARADHIPGATYTGTFSGGGTVEFRVSADGGTVSGFTVKYPSGTCRFPSLGFPPMPINGHSFSGQSSSSASMTGSFTGVQTASGTFTVIPNYPDCAGTFSWTARTTSPPADTTPPDTTIADGPSGPTRQRAPSFAFASTEPDGTFECRIDGAAFAACGSPFKTATLADGPHTFEVKATDKAGNADPTPASRSFTVDATAPQTTIMVGPTGKTANKTPRFAFRSSERASTFRCRLDGKRWVGCRSPKQLARLSVGRHAFDVQASDALGNRDPSPAHRTFRIVVD